MDMQFLHSLLKHVGSTVLCYSFYAILTCNSGISCSWFKIVCADLATEGVSFKLFTHGNIEDNVGGAMESDAGW